MGLASTTKSSSKYLAVMNLPGASVRLSGTELVITLLALVFILAWLATRSS